MEVYMCTRSTPGSITYEKCDHISTIDYTKVSYTKKFILQETHSAPLLSDIEGSQCRGQKTEQGKSQLRSLSLHHNLVMLAYRCIFKDDYY